MIKVMIVEDDPMVRHVNAKFLKKIPEFSLAQLASSLTEAKDFVLAAKPDLILLDVFLPRENGIDFLKWLRKEEIGVDVVLITADKSMDTVQEAFRYGAIDYLIKPFTFERFKEALHQYQERRQSFEKTVFIDQDELDRYILSSKPNEDHDLHAELEKGLNRYTYKMIEDVISQKDSEYFTAEELAEELGMARVTVRKYLEYMDKEGKLDKLIEYGKVGRPQHKYRRKDLLERE